MHLNIVLRSTVRKFSLHAEMWIQLQNKPWLDFFLYTGTHLHYLTILKASNSFSMNFSATKKSNRPG